MSAENRSSLLNELTAIPESKKAKKSPKRDPAKAQQATVKLNKLSSGKKTKSRKQMREEQVKDIAVINAEVKAVQAEVINPVGRPSDYTPELAAEICARIATGESMRSVSRDESMPAMTTIFKWLREHEEFSQQYTRATQERAEAFQEDILDISDDGHNDWMEANYGNADVWITNGEALQRSRLRVDTRKWLMARMNPRKYGDKVDLTTNGKDLPIPMLGGASSQPNAINDKNSPLIPNQVPENAG